MAIEEKPKDYLDSGTKRCHVEVEVTYNWFLKSVMRFFFPLSVSQGKKKMKLWHRKDLKWIQMGHCMTR